MTKQELRRIYAEIRRGISNREEKEFEVREKLRSYVLDKPDVFCYVSMGSELDTHCFIREEMSKRTVLVPYTQNGIMVAKRLSSAVDLTTDRLGNVSEGLCSDYAQTPSVIIVPMLAFNVDNYRLGYGGGYYDRYLSDFTGLKIGLAFDEQEAELVLEPFDVPLDVIITPSKIRERSL